MENLAIIASGGGTSCGFGAGSMIALSEYGITPKVINGCSGNGANAVYFTGGHFKELKEVWTERVHEVIKKGLFKKVDVNHLIDELLKKDYPFDKKKVYGSETLCLVPSTNKESGMVEYFSNKNKIYVPNFDSESNSLEYTCKKGKIDLYEAMRATKSCAILSTRRLHPGVEVNGSKYFDTLLSSSTKAHYKKVIDEGVDKIIIIDNTSERMRTANFAKNVFNTWLFFKNIKKKYEEFEKQIDTYDFPRENVFVIEPKNGLNIGPLCGDKKKLEENFWKGYIETKGNKQLEKFLKD